jgi:hypothetical protein
MTRAISEPHLPEYELARAMWMELTEGSAKSFDRLNNTQRNPFVAKALRCMDHLERISNMFVVHYKEIDGG